MSVNIDSFHTPIVLDRDAFMRQLIASLGHLNEGILGSEVAGAYVMNVGLSMGAAIEEEYKRFWGLERPFTVDEYAHVIVDLKQKIQGDFSLVAKDDEKVVVRTTSCPFDEFVRQSPSLCFMTSSVFGGIAARNFGYGKSVLHKRIALGDPGCYVTVYLKKTQQAEEAVGREYFPNVDQASPDIREQLRLMDSVGQLRRQLGETRSRWEEVVRGAAEAIVALDASGAITFANARWRDLLGVESNELEGMALGNLVHPDEREQFRKALSQAREGGRTIGVGLRLQHRNTLWRDVSMSAAPVRDEAGRNVGVIAIVRDVTEEREAQRLKDEFLSTASHELRTPVTTIRGLTELLLRAVDRGDMLEPAQLAKRLRTIQREADRLALLGVDLLDASRLQSGRLSMKLERYDLNALVWDAVQRKRETLEDDALHHLTVQAHDSTIPVEVERARLEQVLSNLLDNAVKYSPEGGDIIITTGCNDEDAWVSFRDFGIGIQAEDLPNLFTPFYRGSNASSRSFPGLGLGLYLSKGIVEAHGGRLAVESLPGSGSTFTLYLPLVQEEEQHGEHPTTSS